MTMLVVISSANFIFKDDILNLVFKSVNIICYSYYEKLIWYEWYNYLWVHSEQCLGRDNKDKSIFFV
jgi:hypothetical protein